MRSEFKGGKKRRKRDEAKRWGGKKANDISRNDTIGRPVEKLHDGGRIEGPTASTAYLLRKRAYSLSTSDKKRKVTSPRRYRAIVRFSNYFHAV